MIKNYLKSYGYLFISILILTVIFTSINFFFPFPTKTFKVLIPMISIIISTIILGKSAQSKAYIEGAKFTSIYIIISIIFSIIIKNTLTIKLFLYYIIILLTGMVGSMIGINLNKDKR